MKTNTNESGSTNATAFPEITDGDALNAAIGELADLDRIKLVKAGKRLTILVNPALLTDGDPS